MAASKKLTLKSVFETVVRRNTLVFTRDRRIIGRAVPIPRGANDLHIHWRNRVIVKLWWTKDGIPVGYPVKVPLGANDIHLYL